VIVLESKPAPLNTTVSVRFVVDVDESTDVNVIFPSAPETLVDAVGLLRPLVVTVTVLFAQALPYSSSTVAVIATPPPAAT